MLAYQGFYSGIKGRIQANITMFLLTALRWMLRGRGVEVRLVKTLHSTAPRAQRRALGKLVAKGVTKGIPG